VKKNIIIFNLILIALFLIPATSNAIIINYTISAVESFNGTRDPFVVSTPEGSYTANLSGSVLIDSEAAQSYDHLNGRYNLFNIIAFSLAFDIPDLNETLAFASTGISTLRVYDELNPWGEKWLHTDLNLHGTGNFSDLFWSGSTISDSYNGELQQNIFISGDESFWGTGAGEGWVAPVIEKDNWTSLATNDGHILLTHTPVPEPATIFLFGTGIACLVGSRIRKKKK